MNLIKLEGSYYEIGSQYGKMIKGRLKLPKPEETQKEWVSGSYPHLVKYTSNLLEELRGVADAADLDQEVLATHLFYNPFFIGKFFNNVMNTQCCTSFVITRKNVKGNHLLFARNYDWGVEYSDFLMVTQVYPDNKISSMGFSDHMIGRYGGVNASGIAVAVNAVALCNVPHKHGLLLNVTTRWILDNCKTTKEVVAFLEKIPHCEGYNYLVTDRIGDIARIEISPEKVHTSYPKNSLVVATNHYQSQEMKNQQFEYNTSQMVNDEIDNSTKRLTGIVEWFKEHKNLADIESVKKILRNHEHEVCYHKKWKEYNNSTIWSWITLLGTRTIEVCQGSPCNNEYKSLFFETR
jgi:predicted choloylglycine hydrolase